MNNLSMNQKKAKVISSFVIDGRVVDFGSDEGIFHQCLKKHHPSILSVDKFGSPDFIQDFNKPFVFDGPFDTIIASEVIEHLNNPLEFLKECKKCLVKDGRIIITTPNALGIEEFRVARRIRKHHEKPEHQEYTSHIYNWNKQNFDKLVWEAGLKVEHFSYKNFYWTKNYPFMFISSIIKELKPQLFYILQNDEVTQ